MTKTFARAAALSIAVAATSVAAPMASAGPITPGLALTLADFPAGSTAFETGGAIDSRLDFPEDTPPECLAAAGRVNDVIASSQGVSSVAIFGYSAMTASVVDPLQAQLWRDMNQICAGVATDREVPGDLLQYNTVITTYVDDGRVAGIEGIADVNGHTVDVYVEGLNETIVNEPRFWELLRKQIQKVQAPH